MLQKILHSFCALLVTAMLFGIAAYAQNNNMDVNNNTNKITNMAQNGDVADNNDDDNDTDWGWIGLLGLAGLLGLRRNDRKD
ncbi:MYXO-CTERM domain-containing protein [Parageobacillus thermantarcticus]|uniref:MYXO-CTERM domain-containing protein n=1 Tax=Parageobacillus thermantarcticus TaxID=186116 RepID=A0A1I0SPN5_9BACL|nr:WGxxGxxG family protein [Parageobacillus thermantarcticus]SFA41442.1 MYXO-CTERM domain-containing protein [Parageobacillus thermantarcticus]